MNPSPEQRAHTANNDVAKLSDAREGERKMNKGRKSRKKGRKGRKEVKEVKGRKEGRSVSDRER